METLLTTYETFPRGHAYLSVYELTCDGTLRAGWSGRGGVGFGRIHALAES